MQKPLIMIILCMSLAGCNTLRQVPIVKESTHDTLYVNRIQYDSIYIDNWHQIDHSRDTVVIREILRENKYKLLRDTVRVVQIDSIPVIRTVEVVKTERHIPLAYKWCFGICIILIASTLVIIVIRVISLTQIGHLP